MREQGSAPVGKAEALEFRRRMLERHRGKHNPPRLSKRKKPKLGGATHLIVGDGHVIPGHSNHRWEWLGRMIADIKPDVVIDIGDSASMESLSFYDLGKKCFEGRRYWKDVDAYVDAKERLDLHLRSMRRRPRLVKCNGNHEHRIDRIVELEPRFDGLIGLEDLRDAEMGWEVYAYEEPVKIDGMFYVHYDQTLLGKFGGVHPCRMILLKKHCSIAFGHTHRFGFHSEPQGDRGSIKAFNVGGFFEEPTRQLLRKAYAGARADLYDLGILELRGVEGGRVRSWRWHDLREIAAKYG
jgi:hypothetical protein